MTTLVLPFVSSTGGSGGKSSGSSSSASDPSSQSRGANRKRKRGDDGTAAVGDDDDIVVDSARQNDHRGMGNRENLMAAAPTRRPKPKLLTSSSSSSIRPSLRQHGFVTDGKDDFSPGTRTAAKFQKLGLQTPIEGRLLPYHSKMLGSGATGLGRDGDNDEDGTTAPGLSSSTLTAASTLSTNTKSEPLSSAADFVIPTAKFDFSHTKPPSSSNQDTNTGTDTGPKSPPPLDHSSSSEDLSSLFWQPSEITGWTPDDPDEDNRGVNGVGYELTRTQQQAVDMKKKRQMRQYQMRLRAEEREQRKRRRVGEPHDHEADEMPKKAKKVARFVEVEDR